MGSHSTRVSVPTLWLVILAVIAAVGIAALYAPVYAVTCPAVYGLWCI